MKVSIVIPTYNGEKYLEECIKSALAQSYNDLEIICVDDGSTDKSLEIMNKYSDQIKIISKKNGGTATALNAGIKAMTGEWFKWLSADDVLYPSAIEDLIAETQKVMEPQKKIFYSNFDYIDANSKVTGEYIEPNYNELTQFEFSVILLDHFIGNGTTAMIHKSAFEKYGLFEESLDFADDYEFWLRCCILHGFRLHLVPKKLAKYRIHEKQLTNEKFSQILERYEKIRQLILSKLEPIERQKYEIAWKKYLGFRKRLRKAINSFIQENFSISTQKKISNIIQKLKGN